MRGKTEEYGAVDPVEEPSQRQHKGGLAKTGQHLYEVRARDPEYLDEGESSRRFFN